MPAASVSSGRIPSLINYYICLHSPVHFNKQTQALVIMIADKYIKLRSYLNPNIRIPETFFTQEDPASRQCIFMLSCLGKNELLYLEETFSSLTGFTEKKLKETGMDFWFSRIHPDDMEEISKKIIESHRLLDIYGFNEEAPSPLVLTYRVKHANGNWVMIRETKFLVSYEQKMIDKVLGKFEEVLPAPGSEEALKQKLEEEKSCTKLLDFALVHQHDTKKQVLVDATGNQKTPVTAADPKLTRREKEILQLIGEGLSTKLIAHKCHISINTVETHRRHLLEKLQVKNSMELIKEASKIFWL